MPLPTPAPARRPAGTSAREWISAGVFGAIAVGVWGVGYVAAAAAAGRPTSGLGAFYRRLLQGLIPPFQASPATPVTRRPALTWWSLEGITHPMSLAIFWLVVAGIIGGAATLAAIAWYNWRGGLPSIGLGPRAARGMSGSSHFASGWELRKLRALGRDNPLGRLVIGYHGPHLLTAPADHHAIVIGVTGKGKTVAYAIPAVLEWPGPVVAVSVKTDLIEHTVGARQRAGRVKFYDPTDSAPQYHTRAYFNPVRGCRTVSMAQERGPLIAVGADDEKRSAGGGIDGHWYKARDALLTALLCAAATANYGMEEVRRWVNEDNYWDAIDIIGGDAKHNEYAGWKAAQNEGAGPPVDERIPPGSRPSMIPDPAERTLAWEILMSALKMHPKTLESVFSVTKTALQVWLDPHVVESASGEKPQFDVEEFLGGRHTLYLVAPAKDMERVAPLNVALIMEIVNTIAAMANRGRVPNPPLLFVFDEMANVAPLPKFEKIVSTFRGLNVRLMSIFQDVAQMQSRFGKEATGTIINNHRVRIALSGNADRETGEYFAALAGQQTVRQTSTTFAQGQQGRSVGQSQQALIDSGSFRTFDETKALCLVDSLPPFYVEQRPYFTDRKLAALAAIPYIPGVEHWHEPGSRSGPGGGLRTLLGRCRVRHG